MTYGTLNVDSVVSSDGTTAGGLYGFKNRIINGAMVIDQRNAGASVTLTAAGFVYPADRWAATRGTGTSGAIAQRVSGSYVGGYALRVQRNNGDTGTATLSVGQVVESANCIGVAGNNITTSFRARCGANFSGASSQITARVGTGTGTDQSAALFWNIGWTGQSNSNNAITLTTSWQTFTVTVSAGASVNQVGVMFYYTPTGTAGANDWFEIEEVQLEKGSTATSFDYRPYGTELLLCQRYLPAFSGNNNWFGFGIGNTSTQAFCTAPFPVQTRVAPTGIVVSSASHFNVTDGIALASAASSIAFNSAGVNSGLLIINTAAGVTIARPTTLVSNSSSANLYFTGCEL